MMQIRLATMNDVCAISKMLIVLANKFIVGDFEKEGVDNILRSMSPKTISWLMDKGYRYHVGEIHNELVGVVGTRENSHLYHLFVKESEQGKGYSKQLWTVAKQCCIAAGNQGEFTVNSSINAQAVYKGWGFVPVVGIRISSGVKDIPMKLVITG